MFKGWSRIQKIAYGALLFVLVYLTFLWYSIANAAQNATIYWNSSRTLALEFDRDFNSNRVAVFKRNPALWGDATIFVDDFWYGEEDRVKIVLGCPPTDYRYFPRNGDEYRFYEYQDYFQVSQSEWLPLNTDPPEGLAVPSECERFRVVLPLVTK